MDADLLRSVRCYLEGEGVRLSPEKLAFLVQKVQDQIQNRFADRLISQVEKILEIDPFLTEGEILQTVARNVAEFLQADFVSIRIWEESGALPYSPVPAGGILEKIPFEKEIADEVIRTGRSTFVPDILNEPRCQNREKAEELGVISLLAVPISLPRFSFTDEDLKGVLQIFYKKKDKAFTPEEIQIAEMLSRRVGYVIARKRIHSLQKINLTRDRILEDIYLRLGRGEGIKMKDVFNSVIPELADIMKIQRCTLFSIMDDREHVMLEAGFPEAEHGIGKVFSVTEPYVHTLLHQTGPFGDFEWEKIHPSYILISDPQKSRLLLPHLKHYLATRRINCVLYIPLQVDGTVQYFLAFDAQAQRQNFAEEEIMMFSFLGKELVKGLRLEKMDNILHDFKNPAIAIGGFAKRVQKMLEEAPAIPKGDKIRQAMEIILQESTRIQALALTLHSEGKESILDLAATLKERFLVNREVAWELDRKHIQFRELEMESPLWIRCYPLSIGRVIDNVLNNASHATPDGGELSVRSYRKSMWAVAEIANTGEISENEIERYLSGEGRGRGLHITTRLIKHMGGNLEVESKKGKTIFRIGLPLVNSPFI